MGPSQSSNASQSQQSPQMLPSVGTVGGYIPTKVNPTADYPYSTDEQFVRMSTQENEDEQGHFSNLMDEFYNRMKSIGYTGTDTPSF